MEHKTVWIHWFGTCPFQLLVLEFKISTKQATGGWQFHYKGIQKFNGKNVTFYLMMSINEILHQKRTSNGRSYLYPCHKKNKI